MRRLLTLACIVMFVGIVPAGAQQVFDQYKAAAETFGGGWKDREDFIGKEPLRLLDAIEGKWANLSLLGDNGERLFGPTCERIYVETSKISDFTFKLTGNWKSKDKTIQVDVTYNAIGGNSFSFSTDLDQYFARMFPKGSEDKVNMPLKLSLVRSQQGVAQIYRPSADILVIVQSLNPAAPDIYARCPAQ